MSISFNQFNDKPLNNNPENRESGPRRLGRSDKTAEKVLQLNLGIFREPGHNGRNVNPLASDYSGL